MAIEKNNDKMKVLDAVLLQIEKQYGKGSIMRLGDEAGKVDIEVIPTGCLTLDIALELSSMGVRVDEEALIRQLNERGCPERAELEFHKALLNGELPYTIGGGIGQSRLCMLMMGCAHIGEVQSSIWDANTVAECEKAGIRLL